MWKQGGYNKDFRGQKSSGRPNNRRGTNARSSSAHPDTYVRRMSFAGSNQSLAADDRGGIRIRVDEADGGGRSATRGGARGRHEQNNENGGRGRGRHSGPKFDESGNRRDVRPLRYGQMMEMLEMEAYEIVIKLTDQSTGLKELLNSNSIGIEMLVDIMKLLHKAFSTRLHQYNQNALMAIVLDSNFFSLVMNHFFSPVIQKNAHFFQQLILVFEIFFEKMPDITGERMENCIRACAAAVTCHPNIERETLVRIQELVNKMEALEEEKQNETMRKRKVKIDSTSYEDEPPEDFRELSTLPSIHEIRARGRPFLRPNVVSGAYKNADHYLDVNFRLLREDFVSPLRDGIAQFLHKERSNDPKKKIKDIRLYENVKILRPKYSNDGMFYDIQFSCTQFRRIKWEISRRLIFGSLLCLSSDSFDTAIFASVADRKPEDLKKGIITVKFEDELEVRKELTKGELLATYIMAESQAYFEAYRHFLKGLQTFNSENLPLQNYIVNVQRHREEPHYLDYETTYDFTNVVKDETQSRRAHVVDIRTWPSSEDFTNVVKDETQSRRAHVVDIRTWPSSEDLELDESQRRAMHLALSSAVAVIQGPPGTGKTYLGLKIMKMLLSNKHVWQTSGQTNPILVVCLTNHALDQFLEGMLSFTENIIRVGGRSKNEMLSNYTLRHRQNRLFFERTRESYIHESVEQHNVKLRCLRQKMEIEKERSLLLNVQILHENALSGLGRHDGRLVDSFIEGFVEYFQVDPTYQSWCPNSFLATWLGLTVDNVDEYSIDEFLHEEATDFRVVGAKTVAVAQPNLKLLAAEDLNDSDDDLIDVEDEIMAANRNRQMEAEGIKEIEVLQVPKLRSEDWSVLVDYLDDPIYFIQHLNNYEYDERNIEMNQLYHQMGIARKLIAQRELSKYEIMDDDEIARIENVWDLDYPDRWRLYRRWINKFRAAGEEKIIQLQGEYVREAKRLKEVVNAEELSILRYKDIVGMTTTGAAKYLETLRELKPKIVIVEEAAEVLESHIVTALSSSTDHLILIGDHQQLRPNVTVYRLAQEYHMDISLFERLIRNDVNYATLQLQHRMRPEISQLLKPHIYKTLDDHPCVYKYPHVEGIATDVFFFNHNNPEEADQDSKTHSNPFEAQFLVALCRYLLQQGYEPEQITILTAYAGQLFTLRKLMDKTTFEGVKVTVVDNYQGEENDIILLSFVRSNEEGKIGFLKIDNRINVALSRAKIGLFCVGNFKFFASKSDIWRKICNHLEIQGHTGEEMTLRCQRHQQTSIVRNGNDFIRLSPEGGCLQICDDELKCGHKCERVCHVTEHRQCEQRCNKEKCPLQHDCPLKCFEPCQPCAVPVLKYHLNCEHREYQPCHVDISTVKCKVLVERELKCGHLVMLKCHVDFDAFSCVIRVKRTLPYCGHERDMRCSEDPEKVECKIDCKARLDCGHVCNRKCHPRDDPEHEQVKCMKSCDKKICERGHKCKNMCFQPCNECLILVEKERPCGHKIQHPCSKEILETKVLSIRFLEKCNNIYDNQYVSICTEQCKRILPCGHPCMKKCNELCGDCNVIVDKILYCTHVVKAKCKEIAASIVCTMPCTKRLACGHLCTKDCGQVCETQCTHPIGRMGLCGHLVDAPCHLSSASDIEIAQYCKTPCRGVLGCEHLCKGTCGRCRQGRVHVPCEEKCGRPKVCGHSCKSPCATLCPPCQSKCDNQCNHSKCQKLCGNKCKTCKEFCMWKCEHLRCTKKCGEMCNRERCDQPCRLRLPCHHPCIGLCGEKCPRLCRVCNREELLEFQLYGNEEEEDSRFVQLSDCGHCIEVEGLDHWMEMDKDQIKMKTCPRCNATIWRSFRYGNIIKQRMAEVQDVKVKAFGKKKNLRFKMNEIHGTIQNNKLKQHFPEIVNRLVKLLTGKPNLHQNHLIVMENQINILTLVTKCKEKFKTSKPKAEKYLEDDLKFLVERLMSNEEKMNEYEIEDIGKELTRIELWTTYLNIEETTKIGQSLDTEALLRQAKMLLSSHLKLTLAEERSVQDILRRSAEDYLPGLGITNTERLMIIKAVNLGAGHWYKCPNGHPYAIANCGRANQRSKCPECGVGIGGVGLRLDPGNVDAGEMDGSRHGRI